MKLLLHRWDMFEKAEILQCVVLSLYWSSKLRVTSYKLRVEHLKVRVTVEKCELNFETASYKIFWRVESTKCMLPKKMLTN